MNIYGLIGRSLGHSFSKKYFTDKFIREDKEDCQYLNFELNSLEDELPAIKQIAGLKGLNVTIPYKTAIISFLDELSKDCARLNACNCIKVVDGKWIGLNTDVTGFEKSFTPALKPHHTKALILGTGGASKAVAFVLKKLSIEFVYVSRAENKWASVIMYENITHEILKNFTVVINTTPSGMYPNVDDYPKLPYEYIGSQHYFFDLIYNPAKTKFLSKAEEKGATIQNGGNMLEIQAEESWKIWTGKF